MRKNFYIAISIFSLAFWLWRIPFIFWLPIPEFGPDTFDYFSLVKALKDRTALSYSIDLPLAFPLFIYLTGLFSKKAIIIIWIQFLLKFSAGIFFIYTCWKYYKWVAIPIAIALSIYITDSWSLRYDTCFIPDSIYNSLLFIIIAILIHSIKSPSKASLMALSICMFLLAFTRSNGFFIYFIVPVMIIVLLPERQRVLKYASLIAPALILHVSAFCFKSSSNILHPTDDRVNLTLNRETEALKTLSGRVYLTRKVELTKEYFIMPNFPSFYFSLLPERYRQLYELDNIHDPDYKMFDWTTPIQDDFRKFVYQEYYTKSALLNKNKAMMDVSYAYSHPYYLMIHVVYKIQNIVFRNAFWYLLGIALFAAGFWMYCRSGFANKDALILCMLVAAHFVSVLVVIFGNPRMQIRYSHVTEFLLYLAPIFFLMSILPSYNERKT